MPSEQRGAVGMGSVAPFEGANSMAAAAGRNSLLNDDGRARQDVYGGDQRRSGGMAPQQPASRCIVIRNVSRTVYFTAGEVFKSKEN